MFESAVKHVFISYVHQDADRVTELRQALRLGGINVWTDHDIQAGDFWERVILENIQNAGFLIACFSHASAARPDSYMKKELDLAVRALGTPTPERPWLIPVLLSDIPIPDEVVGETRLGDTDVAKLFDNWDDGVRDIRDKLLTRDPPVLRTVQPTYVFVSDVHTTLHPLTRPAQPPTLRGMLANAEAYEHFYRQQQRIEGTRFQLRPMSEYEIQENHFWKRVNALDAPELPGPWHRQLPVLCEPRDVRLEVDPELDPGATARCRVLLWPGGWSSNLEIDLPTAAPADAVTQLVAGLRSRRSAREARSPLLCNGERVNASGLFRLLAERMRQELGLPPGADTCVVPTNFVLGVADQWRQAAAYERLPGDARAGLHQLLRGARLEPQELDDIEAPTSDGGRKFLYTKLRRRNFVLTVFGRGSVAVLSDGWGEDATDEERMDAKIMRCFTSNVRFATAQTLMLAYFSAAARNSGWMAQAPALPPLVAAAGRELRLLREDGSRFEKNFCRAHRTIADAIPDAAQLAAVV